MYSITIEDGRPTTMLGDWWKNIKGREFGYVYNRGGILLVSNIAVPGSFITIRDFVPLEVKDPCDMGNIWVYQDYWSGTNARVSVYNNCCNYKIILPQHFLAVLIGDGTDTGRIHHKIVYFRLKF
jgi:hypothetical protein